MRALYVIGVAIGAYFLAALVTIPIQHEPTLFILWTAAAVAGGYIAWRKTRKTTPGGRA